MALKNKRCGQCGRTFTKAQWRGRGKWCPKCQKMVCTECVGTGRMCPACATKIGKDVFGIFFVNFLTGLTFLFVGIISVIQNPGTFQTMPEYPLVMLGLPISLITIGFVALFHHYKRKKIHKNYLKTFPEGVIPYDQRSGHADPGVRRKWAQENLKYSIRSAPIMMETF